MNNEFLHDYQPKTQNQYFERPDTTTKGSNNTSRRPDTITTRLHTPLSIEEQSIFQTKINIPYSAKGQQRVDRLLKGSLSAE